MAEGLTLEQFQQGQEKEAQAADRRNRDLLGAFTDLASEIRSMAGRRTSPNGSYAWAIATFVTVILALGTLFQSQQGALAKLVDTQMVEQGRRLALVEVWTDSHDLRVRGLNTAQWERIKALERVTYGESISIEVGEAPGGQSR